jgi:hypothetical protein
MNCVKEIRRLRLKAHSPQRRKELRVYTESGDKALRYLPVLCVSVVNISFDTVESNGLAKPITV